MSGLPYAVHLGRVDNQLKTYHLIKYLTKMYQPRIKKRANMRFMRVTLDFTSTLLIILISLFFHWILYIFRSIFLFAIVFFFLYELYNSINVEFLVFILPQNLLIHLAKKWWETAPSLFFIIRNWRFFTAGDTVLIIFSNDFTFLDKIRWFNK